MKLIENVCKKCGCKFAIEYDDYYICSSCKNKTYIYKELQIDIKQESNVATD